VYYLQQNVAILSHISNQISSIAPQVSIPSTPLPPFPVFKPSASDLRVNGLWLWSLLLSLSAAFLALNVQQWVRNYVEVSQYHPNPLISARVRQYLYEGYLKYDMATLVATIPMVLELAFMLFAVGLLDSVYNMNRKIGLGIIIPFAYYGLPHILMTISSGFFPQSPYRDSFSNWIRSFFLPLDDESREGDQLSASARITEAVVRLATKPTVQRKERDTRAMLWLLRNMALAGDSGIESFAMKIPGAFDEDWNVGDENDGTDRNGLTAGPLAETHMPPLMTIVAQPEPRSMPGVPNFFNLFLPLLALPSRSPTDATISSPALNPSRFRRYIIAVLVGPAPIEVSHEISKPIAHLFETCKNRNRFESGELWRRRTRACVEATASLICYADAELRWFGDILGILGDIGDFEMTRISSVAGMDQSFVVHWTCLSLMVIRQMLGSNESVKEDARSAIASYVTFRVGDGPEDEVAEENAREIDETLKHAWWLVLHEFIQSLENLQIPGSQRIREHLLKEGAQNLNTNFSRIGDDLTFVDSNASTHLEGIHQFSHEITRRFPGTQLDDNDPGPYRIFDSLSDPLAFPFISPGRIVRMFQQHREKNFEYGVSLITQQGKDIEWVLSWQENLKRLSQRQLWRLQDLRDGAGLGFTVELFLIAFKQLLSTSSSQDSHSALYIRTFRTITSDWREYKHSLGTQKILLDAVASDQGIVHQFNYPTYITDELLVLLMRLLKGQTGPHINNAVEQLSQSNNRPELREFRSKALQAISLSRSL